MPLNDRWKELTGQVAAERGQTAQPPGTPEAPPAEEPYAEEEHPSKAYGGLWSRRDRAHKVEFRPFDPNAEMEAFDYTYLPRVKWQARKGVITLLFPTLGVTVTITGLNLFDLKERLRQHLVTWVQEQGGDMIRQAAAKRALGPDFVWVEKIEIHDEGE